MGVIYKIYNDINDKVYIGQTVRTMDRRWKEHLNAAQGANRNTALYNAMRKYGIESFHIEMVKECSEKELDYYEEYYIKQFNSLVPNGYNMTTGGDKGKKLDYDEVVRIYFECNQNEAEVLRKYGIHPAITCYILKEKGYTPQKNYEKQGVPYYECDADNNIIRKFNNAYELATTYQDLGITVAGLHNYIGHQLNNRQKSYKSKYFCRVYDYDNYKMHDHKTHNVYKKVQCIETGMIFEKIVDAARWVKEQYPEYKGSVDTIASNISKSINHNHSSYKHNWKFIS